jgi:hypothetical protein
MDLYKVSNSQALEQISVTRFDLERDIQQVVEKNTQELFNVLFVKSEFSVQGYRIDSLCFDQEAKAFVIIEYKNTHSYSVIDQGFTYLSTMLNNKSDFVLEYNETTGGNLKRDEVDWTQSRVIFVSPSFSQYQKDSVNFKDIPFELWEVKRFTGDLIGFNRLITGSKESIRGFETNTDSVLSEVQVPDEDAILRKLPKSIQKIYSELKERMASWDGVSFNAKRHYVSVLRGSKVKIYLILQKSQIKIDMIRRVDFSGDVQSVPIRFTLDDPKNLFSLSVNEYKEVYTCAVTENSGLDYLLMVMKQKFDS